MEEVEKADKMKGERKERKENGTKRWRCEIQMKGTRSKRERIMMRIKIV